MKSSILIFLPGILLMACAQNKSKEADLQSSEPIASHTGTALNIYGNYVDDHYPYRSEGHDWVAISVKKINDPTISVSVRSRADRKKPTCTFDGKAHKRDDSTYISVYNGKKIFFSFSKDSIRISTERKEDAGTLHFFCSGGATLAGAYAKIQEPLDPGQVDKTRFAKFLTLQGIGFNVSSIEKDDVNTLSVFTSGLEEIEFNETFEIQGTRIVNAEVEDLNSDGSPELLVYTQSDGSGSYGNVLAFSVNNKKSMSQVYFPPGLENKKIQEGYMGHDEFSTVETNLVRRFPVYKKDDTNSNPTGGIRQVTYKLVDGEAMRRFEVVNISDYPE